MGTNQDIFKAFNDDLIKDIRARLTLTGANATGKTQKSLESTQSNNDSKLFGDKSFLFVETGRGKGKMPPKEPIELWMIARGMPLKKSFGIRLGIALHGTTTVSQSNPRDIYSSVVTSDKVDNLIKQFEVANNQEVLREILKK